MDAEPNLFPASGIRIQGRMIVVLVAFCEGNRNRGMTPDGATLLLWVLEGVLRTCAFCWFVSQYWSQGVLLLYLESVEEP